MVQWTICSVSELSFNSTAFQYWAASCCLCTILFFQVQHLHWCIFLVCSKEIQSRISATDAREPTDLCAVMVNKIWWRGFTTLCKQRPWCAHCYICLHAFCSELVLHCWLALSFWQLLMSLALITKHVTTKLVVESLTYLGLYVFLIAWVLKVGNLS